MALENLEAALDGMTDEQIIPTPPTPPTPDPWVPSVTELRFIVGWMKQGVNSGWTWQAIRDEIILRARRDYSKTVTRRMLKEIWDAWQAEIAERKAPEVTEP